MKVSALDELRAAYPYLGFEHGLRGAFGSRFRLAPETSLPLPFPSLRELVGSLKWPTSFETKSPGDYPFDLASGWTHELQGVTNDGTFWYFSSSSAIRQIYVDEDLASVFLWFHRETSIPKVLSDQGYNHFGALDHYQGMLFVPLEHESKSKPPLVAIFDAHTLTYLASAPLLQQVHASWCAVNPANGLLYSSEFGEGYVDPATTTIPEIAARAVSHINAYSWKVNAPDRNHFEIHVAGRLDLFREDGVTPARVYRVQGATFSKLGHLYLVSDFKAPSPEWYPSPSHSFEPGEYHPRRTAMSEEMRRWEKAQNVRIFLATEIVQGGILCIDSSAGTIVRRIPVEFDPGAMWGYRPAEELQDVTIWDLEAGPAPGIAGQLHLLMIDNYPGILGNLDDLYFKHYRVPPHEVSSI